MKNRNRTTTKHFKIFKKEAILWIDRLGLKDWRVDFAHENSPDGVSARAWYGGQIEKRVCQIGLARTWGGDIVNVFRVKESAFHEVCHMLLSDIEAVAEKRSFVPNDLDQGLHQVIRRLEKLFYESGNQKI